MAARFWVGGTDTWDATAGTKWALTSGGAGGQAVPGSSDDVTFDNGAGASGTVTVNTTVSINSLTFNTFVGTLDFATNDNNVTINVSSGGSGFIATGAGSRTLNMGDGTWTMAGSDALFTVGNAALTLNANGSTVSFTGTGNRTFDPGGKTFNIVSFGAAGTSGIAGLGASGTYGTLNITAPNTVMLNFGATATITTLNVTGSSASNPTAFTASQVTGTVATFAVTNNFTPSWCSFTNVTFSVGTHTASSSSRFYRVNGITITAPSGGGSGGGQRVISG